jgi:hypothetical protein
MQNIPKRLIQTARNRNLSKFELASRKNLLLHHPEWEYVFFDDLEITSFISSEFPEYKNTFDNFERPIQKIDFFRYLAIYKLGGFYFDLDVLLCESIDNLLAKKCVFPFEELTLNKYLRKTHHLDWEIGNYAFGAEPSASFLAEVIENCVRSQKDSKWIAPMMAHIPLPFRAEFRVLNTTGPGMLTRTLAEKNRCATDITILFPDDVCAEQNWHQFGQYGVHMMAATWRNKGNFLTRKLALLWESKLRKKQLAESKKMGPTREIPRKTFTA